MKNIDELAWSSPKHEIIIPAWNPENKNLSNQPESVSSYRVTLTQGNQLGIGASVSGAGAFARVSGSFNYSAIVLEKNEVYSEMRKKYSLSAGISGFWSFISGSASGSTEREDIQKTFDSLISEKSINGTVNILLLITGQYANVRVDASAYVFSLEIEDRSGNTFSIGSAEAPQEDTGAHNPNSANAHQQPIVSGNDSTITFD